MLIGIGTDITAIGRIEAMIANHGERFLRKIFTADEIAYCRKMANPAIHFAGRWAAKEAFYKALPPSIQSKSTWKGIQIVARNGRKPAIEVVDSDLKQAVSFQAIGSIHLSISHEQAGYCVAFVVVEGV
ncbi:MAG: holo-ACP synthase [Chitinispirillaceae bacterium]|nr:holo-ACP synthase [Chitinispirillaceae bacterium]